MKSKNLFSSGAHHISSLKSPKMKKHFIFYFTLVQPRNIQIQFQEKLFFEMKMTDLYSLHTAASKKVARFEETMFRQFVFRESKQSSRR